MDKANANSRTSRLPLFAGIALVGLVLAGFLIYWFLFRDTAPASVDSVAAAEARQQAIDEAIADDTAGSDAAVDSQASTGDEAQADAVEESDTELDVGQPDAAASVGAETDGVWTVDTSIGTFDDSCLSDVCGSTFAGFRINEELASIGAKTVVGRTPDVSGSMELVGSQVAAASFTVDMTTLITDNETRTSALRELAGGLETDTFPDAIFVLTQPIELGQVPAEGVSIQIEAVGDLTVHGVTRQVTIPLEAELQAGLISIFGNLEGMLLADYDIPKPTAIVVVSVEDNATMELQLFLSR